MAFLIEVHGYPIRTGGAGDIKGPGMHSKLRDGQRRKLRKLALAIQQVVADSDLKVHMEVRAFDNTGWAGVAPDNLKVSRTFNSMFKGIRKPKRKPR